MKVVVGYPPNYEAIKARFDIAGRPVCFTYGETLYLPRGGQVPDHLMAHEETHARQQEVIGVKQWWKLYLTNDEFRLEQELEAYRNQYNALRDYGRKVRREMINKLAKDLASPIYGGVVSRERAKELITGGNQ